MSGYCPDCGNTMCICNDIGVNPHGVRIKPAPQPELKEEEYLRRIEVESFEKINEKLKAELANANALLIKNGEVFDRLTAERDTHARVANEQGAELLELRAKNAYLQQNYNEANDNVKEYRARLERQETFIAQTNTPAKRKLKIMAERDAARAMAKRLAAALEQLAEACANPGTWGGLYSTVDAIVNKTLAEFAAYEAGER